MNSIFDYLADRMKEPSTYVSLGVLLTGVGVNIAPEKWAAISGICMGIGGFVGLILKERQKTTPTEIKNVVEAVVKPSAISANEPSMKELQTAMKRPTSEDRVN